MWAILKIDRKKFGVLKKDLKDKLGSDTIFYNPKLLIQKYKNNKLINKEFNLLGDYLFCFCDVPFQLEEINGEVSPVVAR